MGEGILIYGLNNDRRKYTRDLQTFADKVLKIGRPKGLLYKFGNISRTVARYMREQRLTLESLTTIISDKTILKYRNHPKRKKGAVVSFKRFVMVEAAVKKPRNVYIDTNRNRLVFVSSVKYASNKVLKVVIEPNQNVGGRKYNVLTSIGVVNSANMNSKQYRKIK